MDYLDKFGLPTLESLNHQLSLMAAYVHAQPEYAVLYSDLLPFLEHMNARLKNVAQYPEGDRWSPEEREEYTEVALSIQICSHYFVQASQLFYRGSVPDLFSAPQLGFGFVSSPNICIRVLNHLARTTLTLTRPDKPWYGFAVFSNTLNFGTSIGEVIIQPYQRNYGIEFVHDWAIMSHEIGHIFYWGKDHLLLEDEFFVRTTPYFPSLLSEFLADLYGLTVGYGVDPILYAADFERVRAQHQDARSSQFFAHSCGLRMMHVLIYALFHHRPEIAQEFFDETRPRRPMRGIFRQLAELGATVLAEVFPEHHAAGQKQRVNWRRCIQNLFYKMAEVALSRLDDSIAGQMERMIVELASTVALRKCPPSLHPPRTLPYDRGEYRTFAERLCEGHVIEDEVAYPISLIYELIAYSQSRDDTDLGEPEMSHVRTACILSLWHSMRTVDAPHYDRLGIS